MNYFKKELVLFLTLVLSIAAAAQTFSVDQGKSFAPPEASKWGGFAGENENSFFLLRVRTKGRGTRYYIESISKKTREKNYEVELPLEEEAHVNLDPINLDMRVLCANDVIYIFFKGYVKEEKLTKYFVKTLQVDGKLGEMTILASSEEKIDLNFYQSPDKTKILVIEDLPWVNNRQVSEATMYDASSLTKIWHKNLPDEMKNSPIQTYYYIVDNSGGLYFLLNYIESDEPRVIGKGVGFLGGKTEKAKMLVLPNKTHFSIENSKAMISEDGHFIYSGLYKFRPKADMDKFKSLSKKEQTKYSNELDEQKVVGIFSYIIDFNTSGVISNNEVFPADVAAKLDYAGGLLTKGAANKYYSASKLIEANSEFYLIENHSYTISGDHGSFNYEREFIITKINKQGAISWIRIYPKNTVNGLNTFNTLVHNGDLFLFYLEHPKNLEKGIDDYNPMKYADIKTYNGSVVVALKVSPDGSAVRKTVFENSGWCYDPQPFNILLEKDNSLLFRMINRGDERYDVVKIN